jgi:hypothetical protein
MLPVLFALASFQVGSYVYAPGNLHGDPFYVSYVAGMIGLTHHTQLLLVEMGSLELFVLVGLKL